jgi:hypothetical protein
MVTYIMHTALFGKRGSPCRHPNHDQTNSGLYKVDRENRANVTPVVIYIARSHDDHFFGLPSLLEHFRDAIPVEPEGAVKHMRQQVDQPY